MLGFKRLISFHLRLGLPSDLSLQLESCRSLTAVTIFLQVPLLQYYPHPGRNCPFLHAGHWRIIADKSGHEVMKLDDLAEVTKLYCVRIYNGEAYAKALFKDSYLSDTGDMVTGFYSIWLGGRTISPSY